MLAKRTLALPAAACASRELLVAAMLASDAAFMLSIGQYHTVMPLPARCKSKMACETLNTKIPGNDTSVDRFQMCTIRLYLCDTTCARDSDQCLSTRA